jgi:hypothetical protein
MALKRIRLLWATPPLPDGHWRFGLYHLQQTPDPARPLPAGGVPAYWKGYLHHTLNLSARGLLAWGAGALFLAYLVGAAILLQRLEAANPHNRVTYLDLVAPHRWAELKRLRGEGFAELGRDRLREGQFGEGFGLLRLGLDRNPADAETRLDVARIYLALRLRPQGEQILRVGLRYGYPGRIYLTAALAVMEEGDRPEELVDFCREARGVLADQASDDVQRADARWLDQAMVKACMAAGRSADALALVADYPEDDPFRREVTVLHLLASGQPQAALALAAKWAAQAPASGEALRMWMRAGREAEDMAAMDEALRRLRALAPASPDALLYGLTQNQLAGRAPEARANLDELIFRHGASPGLYQTLAAVLSEVGFPGGLERVERELRERGLSTAPVAWIRLQQATRERDWPAALAVVARLRQNTRDRFSEAQLAYLETMTRLANACLDGGGGTQAALVAIVSDRPGTLRLYAMVLTALLDAGRIETARQILTLADGPFPAARSLEAARARLAKEVAPAPAPEPAEPAGPAGLPAIDTFMAFRSAFEHLIAIRDPAGALALLSAARRAQPGWLAGETLRIEALELPLRARGDDPLVLQLLARNALGRDAGAAASLLALARAVREEGFTANSTLLVKEIIRRDPGATEALQQLAAWEPAGGRRPLDLQ